MGLRLLPAIVLLVLAMLVTPAEGWAPAPMRAIFAGVVLDAETNRPLAGARVVVGDLEIVANAEGMLPRTKVPLREAVEETIVMAHAPGYQNWQLPGVTLQDNQPIEIRFKLWRVGAGPAAPLPPADTLADQPAAAPLALTPPEYIEIGRTYRSDCFVPSPFDYVPVQRMRFVDYLRNVLPSEWIASWPDAALDAGAIAVKQYAWYNAFVQPKWRNRGYSFDLLNTTCDQVYKPDSAHPRTDAAIRRTWSTVLTREGRMFPTYYRSTDAYCGALPDCMGQWGSHDRAMQGMNGVDILLLYYAPAVAEDYLAPPVDPCSSEATALTAAPASSLPEFDGEFRIYLPLVAQCSGG